MVDLGFARDSKEFPAVPRGRNTKTTAQTLPALSFYWLNNGLALIALLNVDQLVQIRAPGLCSPHDDGAKPGHKSAFAIRFVLLIYKDLILTLRLSR
jgi:hypothetical protein